MSTRDSYYNAIVLEMTSNKVIFTLICINLIYSYGKFWCQLLLYDCMLMVRFSVGPRGIKL
jgi:hypothetical protein